MKWLKPVAALYLFLTLYLVPYNIKICYYSFEYMPLLVYTMYNIAICGHVLI